MDELIVLAAYVAVVVGARYMIEEPKERQQWFIFYTMVFGWVFVGTLIKPAPQ
jgi:hypothetical protein